MLCSCYIDDRPGPTRWLWDNGAHACACPTGSFGINRNNLIEDGSCNADFSGDPKLGPLVNNGGDTRTHALLPGSPAIDAISVVSCTLPTDQRGAPRPIVQTSADTPCDIGAFEVQTE